MTQTEIEKLVKKQRDFFNSGETLNVSFRISALEKLRACIIKYEKKINQAICADLGKSAFESYMCETGLVLSELTYMIKHTRKFAKERTSTYTACTVSFKKLSKAISIWCGADYESLELSSYADV